MSQANPLDGMNDPFKRLVRKLAADHLPEELRASDAILRDSDMAQFMRAIEAHDPEALTELRAAAQRSKEAQAAASEPALTPQRSDAAHITGEDLWFKANQTRLIEAALKRSREARSPLDHATRAPATRDRSGS